MKPISRNTSCPVLRRNSLFSSAFVAGVLTSVSAITAMAHPGHALGDHGMAHMISSPYHLLILGIAGVALWSGARFVQGQLPRRLLQVGGIVAVAAAMWLGFGV